MKKIFILILTIFFLTGCVKIENMNYEEIINNALNNKKLEYQNKVFQGYSFYIPKGLKVESVSNNNLILKNNQYKLYLYIDLISYYNKVNKEYEKSSNSFYSEKINFNDKYGYIEINLRDNQKYLVEIMYNYAKIEVIVEKNDIKNILSYAISVLSSITYNDTIIENMIGEDILNYNELEFNIFETNQNNNSSIKYDENSSYKEDNDSLPDLDLIN